MKKIYKTAIYLSIGVFTIIGCKKPSDPTPTPVDPGAGEQEVMTRFELHLKNAANASDTTMAKFNDPEGEGVGAAPTIDTLKVKAGVAYNVTVKVYNDTKKPIVVTSDEILKEANFHRFHYIFTASPTTSGSNLGITITDADTKTPSQPIGLKFNIIVSTIKGKGNFNINLRHFDNNAVKNGNPEAGEQDINLDFPVRIY